jgi:hypothetical protein
MDPEWGPVVAATGDTGSTPHEARHRCLQLQWWPLPEIPAAPPTGPAINVFNIDGGRYRTCRQHPQGVRHQHLQHRWWPLSELPTAPPRGPAINVSNFSGGRCQKSRQHPHGARHRRLQLRWWPLSDLPTAPPRGSPSTSPTSVVATAESPDNTPRGLAINVFKFGGGRCRKSRQHPPRGPAIDAFNFGGGRCRNSRQHRQGDCHRRLQLQW